MHSPPRILIVDDNETNRDLLITRLGTNGFDLLLSKSVISAKHETDPNVWRQPPGTHLNWN